MKKQLHPGLQGQRCHVRITSGLHRVCGRWLRTTGLRVGGSLAVNVADSEASREKKARRRSEIYRPCIYACVGRCRNSSGATINPDTKETQQHGKHTELGFMRWHNFTRFFFFFACTFLQNIGHWLAVRKESGILLFPHRASHPAVPAASARCTRLAHRATCLSRLDRFSFWR